MKNFKSLQSFFGSKAAKSRKSHLNEFLISYRDTHHISTGISPAKAMFRYSPCFSKLPNAIETNIQDKITSFALANDAKAKNKMKAKATSAIVLNLRLLRWVIKSY